jgi:hypothetical protein
VSDDPKTAVGERDDAGGPEAAPARRGSRRVRGVVAGILVVVACVGIVASSVTIWAHRTLLNTDHWVATVAPLGKDPVVVDAVSGWVSDRVISAADLQGRLKQVLPRRAGFLAAPVAAKVDDFIRSETRKLVASRTFYRLWVATNRVAHREIVTFLRGGSGMLSSTNGDVRLDFLPLVADGLRRIDHLAPGLFKSNGPIPDITPSTPPDTARQELSGVIGRQLPAGFGEVLLFHSDKLGTAQRLLKLFDRAVVALALVTAALIAAAIGLAPHRRRTILALGVGTVIGILVARTLIDQLRDSVVNSIKGGQGVAASIEAIRAVVASLSGFTAWFLVAGVVVSVVAFLAGKPQWFRALATAIAGSPPLAIDEATGRRRYVAWAGRHLELLRFGGLAVVVALVLILSPSWVGLLIWLVALGAYEIGLTVLARGVNESGPADG